MKAILQSESNITILGNDFNVFNGFKRFNITTKQILYQSFSIKIDKYWNFFICFIRNVRKYVIDLS